MKVGLIATGYVGPPLAVAFAEAAPAIVFRGGTRATSADNLVRL